MTDTARSLILVVDDDNWIIRSIATTLRSRGYQLVTASDGHEALAQLRAGDFDLVILDVMMPYMDGFEVLKAMRELPRQPDIPILMMETLSAVTELNDKHRSLLFQLGANGTIVKPLKPAELICAVERLLSDGARDTEAAP